MQWRFRQGRKRRDRLSKQQKKLSETTDIVGAIWVETACSVLEAANDLGDDLTIEACQRVIDDDSGGDLPAQSDMNTVFSILDAHAHSSAASG